MSQEDPPRTRARSSGRLRLVVGVPVTVSLVALAAGVGAINLLLWFEPGLGETRARMWATLLVVAFSLLAGGVGWWVVRVLQRPLEELIREVDRRIEERPGRPPAEEGGEVLSPADEVARAHRTVDGYLELLDEYRLTSALLEGFEQAVVCLDPRGTILHANRRAADLLAPGDGKLEGRRFRDVVPDRPGNLPLRSFVRECLEQLSGWEGPGRRTVVARKMVVESTAGEGKAVRVRAHFSPGGFGLGAGAGGGDGSGAEDGPAGRAALLLALEPAVEGETGAVRREHRDRLAALGTLVAEVAHEVRNPLGSLRGMTELLADDLSSGDPKRKHLEALTERVDEVVRYLDEVLDYAQPRRLELEAVDLPSLARETLESIRPTAADEEVELKEEVEPVELRADPRRLRQVLDNLLRNAVEHAGPGGRVTLRGRLAEDGTATVEVHNTGSYIPEERRSEIFRPFVTGRDGGTGLGLSLSRYLVRLHGGRIEVESGPEAGTLFRIRLPVTGETSAAPAGGASDALRGEAPEAAAGTGTGVGTGTERTSTETGEGDPC